MNLSQRTKSYNLRNEMSYGHDHVSVEMF